MLVFTFIGQAPASAQQANEPSPAGGVGIRLLEAPVALEGDPRASSYIVDNLPPGTTISRKIEVANSGDVEKAVSLYAAAATVGAAGFEIGEDRAVNELTTWMSVSPGEVTLAPGASAKAVVTIDVPPDAPEGEQYAVVWAQSTSGTTGDGIQNVNRVGIRTYLSIGAGNGPPTDLAIDVIQASRSAEGAPEVVATVSNTGGRALDPRGTITLSGGPGGISTAPVEVGADSIAPGGSGAVTFTLDEAIPSGPWTAAITVTSGLVSKSSNATLTFPDQGTVTAEEDPSDSGVPVWIWALAVLVVIAIAAAIVVAIRRRKVN